MLVRVGGDMLLASILRISLAQKVCASGAGCMEYITRAQSMGLVSDNTCPNALRSCPASAVSLARSPPVAIF